MITKSKVSIRDVAKEAGVSPATVSGVLNNGGKQNHETIDRVSKAIEQLGYTPRRNKLRKQNKRKRQTKKQFALLFPDADDQGMNTPLAHALIKGVQEVFHESDCAVSNISLNDDRSFPDLTGKNKIDGLIIRSGDLDLNQLPKHIPIVFTFESSGMGQSVDSVMVDNTLCGESAALNMIEQGATNAIIIKPPKEYYALSIKIRCVVFEDVFETRNLNVSIMSMDEFENNHENLDYDCVFVPGHDVEVKQVVQTLKSRREKSCLATVMTADKALKLPKNITHYSLHIDPERIGSAAATQLLWRTSHPLADSCRILIPPKEFKK